MSSVDFADGFATDTQISSGAGRNGASDGPDMRELEAWEPEDNDHDVGGLGGGGANGWRPEDMFEKNKREFGVKSTYTSNLEGYTTQLSKSKTDEYRYVLSVNSYG